MVVTIKQSEEMVLPVSGMTCAACATKVEKALSSLAGVEVESVNAAGGVAGVRFDPTAATLEEMRVAVRDVGYDIAWDHAEFLVLGMMGTHCQSIIEKTLGELEGVVRVAVAQWPIGKGVS